MLEGEFEFHRLRVNVTAPTVGEFTLQTEDDPDVAVKAQLFDMGYNSSTCRYSIHNMETDEIVSGSPDYVGVASADEVDF